MSLSKKLNYYTENHRGDTENHGEADFLCVTPRILPVGLCNNIENCPFRQLLNPFNAKEPFSILYDCNSYTIFLEVLKNHPFTQDGLNKDTFNPYGIKG